MKTILFIALSLEGGGAERVIQLLLEGLYRKKYKLKLIVFNDILEYNIPNDVEMVCLNKKSRYDFIKLIWKLARIYNRERPFIVLSFLTYANIISAIAKFFSRWKGKLVLTEHSNITMSLENSKAKTIKKWLIQSSYPQSDYVVCVSNGAKNDLSRTFSIPRMKLKTIYNAVDVQSVGEMAEQVPPHPWFKDKEIPIIISAGRLVKLKAYPDLLRAFASVRKKTNCHLVIMGQGEERGNLERLADDLGISKNVAMVGFQENPFSFISNSDVFVLSSRWEGFGNVIIEAMACGVPVISTDCPYGPNEIITDGVNGLLVPVGDVEAMADAIMTLLRNHELRARLADAGRKRAEYFSVDKMVAEYEKVFKEVAT